MKSPAVLLPDFLETGFDGLVDDADAFVEIGKCAFHGIDGELFEVGQGEVEEFGGEPGFLAHAGIAHQAVIGVEADAEATTEEKTKGMVFQAAASAGVEVAGEAHFKGHAPVEYVLGEAAEFEGAIGQEIDVVAQTGGVTEAMSATVLQGLPNGVGTIGFARMDRDVEVGALDGMKGIDVLFGRKTVLPACQVKADDA